MYATRKLIRNATQALDKLVFSPAFFAPSSNNPAVKTFPPRVLMALTEIYNHALVGKRPGATLKSATNYLGFVLRPIRRMSKYIILTRHPTIYQQPDVIPSRTAHFGKHTDYDERNARVFEDDLIEYLEFELVDEPLEIRRLAYLCADFTSALQANIGAHLETGSRILDMYLTAATDLVLRADLHANYIGAIGARIAFVEMIQLEAQMIDYGRERGSRLPTGENILATRRLSRQYVEATKKVMAFVKDVYYEMERFNRRNDRDVAFTQLLRSAVGVFWTTEEFYPVFARAGIHLIYANPSDASTDATENFHELQATTTRNIPLDWIIDVYLPSLVQYGDAFLLPGRNLIESEKLALRLAHYADETGSTYLVTLLTTMAFQDDHSRREEALESNKNTNDALRLLAGETPQTFGDDDDQDNAAALRGYFGAAHDIRKDLWVARKLLRLSNGPEETGMASLALDAARTSIKIVEEAMRSVPVERSRFLTLVWARRITSDVERYISTTLGLPTLRKQLDQLEILGKTYETAVRHWGGHRAKRIARELLPYTNREPQSLSAPHGTSMLGVRVKGDIIEQRLVSVTTSSAHDAATAENMAFLRSQVDVLASTMGASNAGRYTDMVTDVIRATDYVTLSRRIRANFRAATNVAIIKKRADELRFPMTASVLSIATLVLVPVVMLILSRSGLDEALQAYAEAASSYGIVGKTIGSLVEGAKLAFDNPMVALAVSTIGVAVSVYTAGLSTVAGLALSSLFSIKFAVVATAVASGAALLWAAIGETFTTITKYGLELGLPFLASVLLSTRVAPMATQITTRLALRQSVFFTNFKIKPETLEEEIHFEQKAAQALEEMRSPEAMREAEIVQSGIVATVNAIANIGLFLGGPDYLRPTLPTMLASIGASIFGAYRLYDRPNFKDLVAKADVEATVTRTRITRRPQVPSGDRPTRPTIEEISLGDGDDGEYIEPESESEEDEQIKEAEEIVATHRISASKLLDRLQEPVEYAEFDKEYVGDYESDSDDDSLILSEEEEESTELRPFDDDDEEDSDYSG